MIISSNKKISGSLGSTFKGVASPVSGQPSAYNIIRSHMQGHSSQSIDAFDPDQAANRMCHPSARKLAGISLIDPQTKAFIPGVITPLHMNTPGKYEVETISPTVSLAALSRTNDQTFSTLDHPQMMYILKACMDKPYSTPSNDFQFLVSYINSPNLKSTIEKRLLDHNSTKPKVPYGQIFEAFGQGLPQLSDYLSFLKSTQEDNRDVWPNTAFMWGVFKDKNTKAFLSFFKSLEQHHYDIMGCGLISPREMYDLIEGNRNDSLKDGFEAQELFQWKKLAKIGPANIILRALNKTLDKHALSDERITELLSQNNDADQEKISILRRCDAKTLSGLSLFKTHDQHDQFIHTSRLVDFLEERNDDKVRMFGALLQDPRLDHRNFGGAFDDIFLHGRDYNLSLSSTSGVNSIDKCPFSSNPPAYNP